MIPAAVLVLASLLATHPGITALTPPSPHPLSDVLNVSCDEVAVIVTSEELAESFRELSTLHELVGVKSAVYTIEWVEERFNGTTTQDKLRSFARYARNYLGAKYLVLGGGPDVIPPAYFYAEDTGRGEEGVYKATDMCYALLDGDWDPDGDGKLLECLDSDGDGFPDECLEPLPDYVPDIIVGRIPLSTPQGVKAYVEGLKAFLTSGQGGEGRALLAASILNYEGEDGMERTDGADVMEFVKASLKGLFNVTELYEGEGLSPSTHQRSANLSKDSLYRELRRGYSLVMVEAHGNPVEAFRKVWVSDDGDGVPEDGEVRYYQLMYSYDVPALEARSVVYLDVCLAGAFDNALGVEALAVRLVKAGAMAVIAPTRIAYYNIGWPSPGAYYSQELVYIFSEGVTEGLKPSLAFYASRAEYLREHGATPYAGLKDVLIYTYLGDPVIPYVLAKELGGLEVSTTYNSSTGLLKVVVRGSDGLRPIPSAVVTVTDLLGRVLNQSLTGVDGVAVLGVGKLREPLKLYVWAPNYRLYLEPLKDTAPPEISLVSPVSGAYINTSNVVLEVLVRDDVGVKRSTAVVASVNTGFRVVEELSEGLNVINLTLPDGTYVLLINATDLSGNEVSVREAFTVDTTPPLIHIASPANNSVVAGPEVRFEVLVRGALRSIYGYVDGALLQHLNTSLAISSKGPHVFRVVATDMAGNAGVATSKFTVDLAPPTIEVKHPLTRVVVAAGYVPITAVVRDDVGVEGVKVLTRGLVEELHPVGRATYTLLMGGRGPYVAVFIAEDLAGRVSTDVVLATTPPLPAVPS